MMAGSDGKRAVAGGLARHIPVLARQTFEQLNVHEGVYIDGTFGAGGHTSAMLGVAGTQVVGIDRDREAIAGGFAMVESSAGRLTLVEDRFSNLEHVARSLGHEAVDGILLDLGVSSMQLDQAGRGFSFRNDGPLDMRMGGDGPSAADLVNAASERDLSFIIKTLGEERFARNVARAIVKARAEQAITTTGALAEIVSRVVRGKPGEVHPATRTFQALRMFVNDELGELVRGLAAAEHMLKANGRLVVISFHSLEDRIVKKFFQDRAGKASGSRHMPLVHERAATFAPVGKSMVAASEDEASSNPRARSAKMRVGARTDAPPQADDLSIFDLPNLASLGKIGG
jgi:16S rRNA (cytosine1402-N4)-methyltransferase